MKQCPYCNAQMADDSKFCGECGKEFPQGNTCPHCGAMVNEGDIYCEDCGRNLKDGSYAFADYAKKSGIDYMTILLSSLVGIVIGLVILALTGGWWYYNSSKPLQTANTVVNDSIAALDTTVVEADEEVIDTMNLIPVDTVPFSDTETKDVVFDLSEDEEVADTLIAE